ncbi:MAG: hypothetical protein GY822_20245 [Deltaproteobacteria bacterium]|nr:hypothetical protein [Deltaproteobacteria bacterium]
MSSATKRTPTLATALVTSFARAQTGVSDDRVSLPDGTLLTTDCPVGVAERLSHGTPFVFSRPRIRRDVGRRIPRPRDVWKKPAEKVIKHIDDFASYKAR